jgi:hypothetical protein
VIEFGIVDTSVPGGHAITRPYAEFGDCTSPLDEETARRMADVINSRLGEPVFISVRLVPLEDIKEKNRETG